jgi:diguanylate cyclase (GGDEF)-like protein
VDPSSPFADITSFYIQEIGSLLFGMVFLFLYRQSKVVYFGLWAIAWVLRLLASFFGYQLLLTGHAGWLAPYATFEFAFAIVLISAARAGFASSMRDWRTVLRLIAILPIFVAVVWAYGMYNRMDAYHVSNALLLGFVYLYNFFTLRNNAGVGARMFRFSLLVLAAAFFEHAFILLYLVRRQGVTEWAAYQHHETYIDFTLHCMLAFAAMAMWSESQIDRMRDLVSEADHLRRQRSQELDLDRLTGLLNLAALSRMVEQPEQYEGVVVVCDMDNFKDINDRYGHLIGDEILRNVGHLLQASIRHEDQAFRWGGDEFVILFHNQHSDVAARRLAVFESRLREFHVRGVGTLPIRFSWGTAETHGRAVREALDEADRNMYAVKRERASEGGAREQPRVG